MKHLGCITKIDGSKIQKVDCITGGSPCQDLSIAGKRQGLKGERSGLFLEQVRIVKEMREDDKKHGKTGKSIRPRYMVWENVPGVLSSNKGKDFRIVLEEIAKIEEPDAVIPKPEKGKWAKAGCIVGNGWSVAWRVHDAKFWGVPQRRKRIALVADFGGQTAPEILFERKSVSGDSEKSRAAGKGSSCGTEKSADCTVYGIVGNAIDRDTNQNGRWEKPEYCPAINATDRHGVAVLPFDTTQITSPTCRSNPKYGDPCYTLSAKANPPHVVIAGFKAGQSMAGGIGFEYEKAATISSKMSGTEPTVLDCRGNGDGKTAPTLAGDHQNRVTDYTAIVFTQKTFGQFEQDEIGSTQKQTQHKQITDLVCYGPDSNKNGYKEEAGTLMAHKGGGITELCCDKKKTVRRLTPLECERLQGYPDGWTDIGKWIDSKGKKRASSDTARYSALGNSIALPFWQWLLERISDQYDYAPTLGSLFDGIGGFPLCWENINGKGTALWASEIEEFCIAVTERRFNQEEEA